MPLLGPSARRTVNRRRSQVNKDAMDEFFASLDIRIVAVALGAAMLIASEIGRWKGHQQQRRVAARSARFNDACMALLGLLIAFTFGTSITRHDQRRAAVVADANAIGDFYTAATLLKDPTRTKLQAVIRQYAQLRLDLTRGPTSTADLQNALVKFDRMHGQMTQLVAQALADGTPIAVSLTNTLNAVSSNQALRLSAYRERLPTNVLALLFVSAIMTALLFGLEEGNDDRSDMAGKLLFILLVSIAVYVTLDLNRPESGAIRVSQEPIERLLSSTLR
jgi:hypothetical protein